MKRHVLVTVFGLSVLMSAAGTTGDARQSRAQSLDGNGAPIFRVDPSWPKPLPNRWSMQQVTGIHVDHEDHIWFLNRAAAAEGDEIGGDGNPPRIDCCVRGPEVIELDQDGTVVHAWGGPGYHPRWPTALQTVIADRQGFVWVGGTAPQDSILKFTRDGTFVWDFGHRPPPGAQLPENNQQTDVLASKGRFQIDEVAREIYIINWKRVLVYDMDSGAFKRGWGGHGMPLSEISNEPIPPYTWTGAPPPAEKNFVPDLHFLEISTDRRVYVGERGQTRIEVFTTEGKFLQEFNVSPGTPARGEGCGGLNNTKLPPCGTTYKLAISRDPAQRYLTSPTARTTACGSSIGRVARHWARSAATAATPDNCTGSTPSPWTRRETSTPARLNRRSESRSSSRYGGRLSRATGYRLQATSYRLATGYGLRADSRILDRDAFFSRSDDPGLAIAVRSGVGRWSSGSPRLVFALSENRRRTT